MFPLYHWLPRRAELQIFVQQRARMLLWLTIVSLLLAVLAAMELSQSYDEARNAARSASKGFSLLLKEQLDGAFREVDLVLRDVAGKALPDWMSHPDQLSPAERRAAHWLLHEKLSTLPQASSLMLMSQDGNWVITPDKLLAATPEQRTLLRDLHDNPGLDMVFSPPVKLSQVHDAGFFVARRIRDDNNVLVGVVMAFIGPEYFNQIARQLDAGDDSELMLLDNDLHRVAIYPEQAEVIGKLVPRNRIIDDWINGRSMAYAVMGLSADEQLRGYFFRRMETFPFLVMVGVSERAYFSDWQRKAAAYVAADVLFMLFGLAMMWRGWREANLQAELAAGTERLREQDGYFLRVLEAFSRPMLIVRKRDNRILASNLATAQLCQVATDDLIDTELQQLFLRPEHMAEIDAMLNNNKLVTDYELKFHAADGGAFWVGISGSMIEYQNEPAYLFSLQDISERKAALEKLWRKATLDPLTNIPNRGYFMERADQELSRAKRYHHSLGLLMLDLDHFKAVNDRYGHDAGDQVLVAFTARLKLELRETDLFGRIGGEEFAILLPEEDEQRVREVAERLRISLVHTPVLLKNGEALSITVSIGCAFLRPETLNIEALLKEADVALYAAKGAGRNRVMFYDPLSERE